MQLEIDGKVIQLSEAGWLENLEEWSEDVAKGIAVNENFSELTQEHWDVINEARAYYHEFGIVAEPRKFSKLLGEKYGPERGSNKYVYDLFPTGLIKCANKVAGLPRPKGCS